MWRLQCRKLKEQLAATEAELKTLQNGKHYILSVVVFLKSQV